MDRTNRLRATQVQTLPQQIAASIRDSILDGSLGPGDRLPSEEAMAEMYGCSRPTVREAMIALEIAGLVEVRVGAGAFVTDKAKQNGAVNGRVFEGVGSSPLELIAARRTIEGLCHGRQSKNQQRPARPRSRTAGPPRPPPPAPPPPP